MVAVRIPDVQDVSFQETNAIFYMERILELVDKQCFAQSKQIFLSYQQAFEDILSANNIKQLHERVFQKDDWSVDKEKQFYQLLQQSQLNLQYKNTHDYAKELLLHISEPSDKSPSQESFERLRALLADNNAHYIEPDEVDINAFIDGTVEFVVENRKTSQTEKPLEGDPGFYLTDANGKSYRCFIKQVSGAKVGDTLNLKITNIPGLTINAKQAKEQIVYLEPRTIPGDLIEVEVMHLSHTGNSFTFRHHSYDGFLWFKRRGVNKELFNAHTIKPKDKILAKVLYTSEEVKRSHKGQITRLGILKAIPVKRLT